VSCAPGRAELNMTIQINEYSHTIYFKLFSGMNFSSATGEARQASEPRVDTDCANR